MSRTDKDAPFWVRAEYYIPDHDWNCPDRTARSWQHWPRVESCGLPPEPVRNDTPWVRLSRREAPEVPLCRWVPEGWDRRYYTNPPRRVDRRIYFHGPNRRVVRDFCVKARQEFAGCGDVEAIEPHGWHPSQLDWWD